MRSGGQEHVFARCAAVLEIVPGIFAQHEDTGGGLRKEFAVVGEFREAPQQIAIGYHNKLPGLNVAPGCRHPAAINNILDHFASHRIGSVSTDTSAGL